MSPNATYHLYSTLEGRPNVGIWYMYQQQEQAVGQPVRLDVDLVKWVASPAIVGGGPTRLSVGPYQYTYEHRGEVYATNQPNSGQDWFLIPSDSVENVWLIAADPTGERVWTAEERRQPIKIKRFTGETNQLFRFVKE